MHSDDGKLRGRSRSGLSYDRDYARLRQILGGVVLSQKLGDQVEHLRRAVGTGRVDLDV